MNERDSASEASGGWPSLPLDSWKSTCDTLHLYAQVVGKIRLALTPAEPEWAHVPLYVTARGLTTSPIRTGERVFQLDFDFVAHTLEVVVSDGGMRSIPLVPAKSVAAFYRAVTDALLEMRIDVRVWPMSVETPKPVRLDEDSLDASYDPESANRFWQALVLVDAALKEHRAPFRRRHTPVQFFWGSFDLAYARFSGRPAAPPSQDVIVRHAMDAEEICAGFWPGDERFAEPAFWCYAFPKPDGIERMMVRPSAAFWSPEMGEFLLRYEDVRQSESPRAMLLEFFSSTFEACSKLAKWADVEPRSS
jgi:hypothetical protein